MEDVAIRVESVSKDFMLPQERRNTLKSHFVSALRGRKSRHETQHALKDISFDIKKGEFFGIVGRNGSGKSTLLKMLAGIYQPTKGKIQVNGKLVPFIELGVGFNPELTGRENVYLNGALLGFSEKEVDNFYDEVVEFAELKQFMDQKLKNYSSGMQVRLAFSMAIRAQADILLIDEVLAVGDADFQRKCYEYFDLLKKINTTVVFVSHDMEAVRRYCDKAVLIDNSRTVKMGGAEMVSQAYIQQFNNDLELNLPELKNQNDNRWGDGSVYIDKLEVAVTNTKITLKETLISRIDTEGFVTGIRIRNSKGENITGSNTIIEKVKSRPLSKGEKAEVLWEIPNVFSDGKYIVDPSVHDLNGVTIYDWWQEAAEFRVSKKRKIPYSVDPGFKVSINYKKNTASL